MRNPRSHHGYALLMTLVLVLLAGAAMVGLAQRSLADALEARSAMRELQRRWAVASLRATLLGRLESLQKQREGIDPNAPSSEWPDPSTRQRFSIELGGREYHIVLTDEQAKLNVNALLRSNTPGETESIVRGLTPRPSGGGSVRIRPTRGVKAVFGYGQVFEGVWPAELVGLGEGDGLTGNVTCWGDGKVNIARASDHTIRRAIQREVGPRVVRMLLQHRRRHRAEGLDGLLKRIDRLGDDDRTKLRRLLTDQSSCHGLWIIARGDQREWYTLAVSVSAGGRVVQWYEFAW